MYNILSGLKLYAKTQQVIFITTGERIRFLYAVFIRLNAGYNDDISFSEYS